MYYGHSFQYPKTDANIGQYHSSRFMPIANIQFQCRKYFMYVFYVEMQVVGWLMGV